MFLVLDCSISLDFLFIDLIGLFGMPSMDLAGLKGHLKDQAACPSLQALHLGGSILVHLLIW